MGFPAFIVPDSRLYQFPVSHERFISRLDKAPVHGQQSNADAFLDGGPECVAVGAHIVADDFLVAHTV